MYEDQEDFQQEYEDEYLKVTAPIRIIESAVLALIPLGLAYAFLKLIERVYEIQIRNEISLAYIIAIFLFNMFMLWLTLHQKARMPDKRKLLIFLLALLAFFILPVTDIVIYLSLKSLV